MKQKDLERLLDVARDYNEPPEPPREEMWAAILAAREAGAEDPGLELDARRTVRERRARLRRWTPWALGLAAAATLAVGFGLGRVVERVTPGVGVGDGRSPVAAAAADAGATEAAEPSLPVQLAAADHMGEAEAMLTLYRSSDLPGDREAAARWARELLTDTHLLMDSRAGRDPKLAALLDDLELVLVQIASASAGAEQDTERELIREGIEERQLMTKLRSAAHPIDMAL